MIQNIPRQLQWLVIKPHATRFYLLKPLSLIQHPIPTLSMIGGPCKWKKVVDIDMSDRDRATNDAKRHTERCVGELSGG